MNNKSEKKIKNDYINDKNDKDSKDSNNINDIDEIDNIDDKNNINDKNDEDNKDNKDDKDDKDDKNIIENEEDIENFMKKKYHYPSVSDKHFQYKLYKKREFYYNKFSHRKILTKYEDIKKFRDNICGGFFKLRLQQYFLSTFINPRTPFTGLLIYHGVGTGKCVHPSTLIHLFRYDILYIYNIKQLWDDLREINYKFHIDDEGGEWRILNNINLYTLSFNNSIVKSRILKIYREKVKTNLVMYKLLNKNYIICSYNHMLLTKNVSEDDKILKWCNIYTLKIGDEIFCYNNNKFESSPINEIIEIVYDDYIYDLEVEETHSYIGNNIICHNTCAAVAIAEKFIDQIKKYNTKIHILVPGQLLKESWKDDIIKCTGETYLKNINTGIVNNVELYKQYKQAKYELQQYYKIMSYRSFYKKVLGQKITTNKFADSNNKKKLYIKTKEGEYERDVPIDKLDNLNNTLLIIDEAHNITDNEYGNAVKKIIKNSSNLKIILLTATPMINFADEIIELVNFIRPQNDPIKRDIIFTPERNYNMSFKPSGREYLMKMVNGYVSHYRGGNPLTFAEQIDIGEIPEGIIYTKLYRCNMLEFQKSTYYNIISEYNDSLDRKSQAVSNFCFPGLSDDNNNIIGIHGKDGLNNLLSQLKSNKGLLQKMINERFYDGKLVEKNIINRVEITKSITGLILLKENIKYFSIKFYYALKNLDELVKDKKGSCTVFFYFNLVKIGIELFSEVLNINGYCEYNDSKNYNINDNTIDALTGLRHKEFKNIYPDDTFYPATYIIFTGSLDDDYEILEKKKKILDSVYNNVNNKDGRFIKIILGSKVMNEGITLENVSEVHIMDVYYNLGKIHQVIGRAVRECKHYKVINDDNKFPKVNIYRYVVSLENELSIEELMYQKAESKYLLIKDVERTLKEIAIDCPINYNVNIFPEEVKKYKNCVSVADYLKLNNEEKKDKQLCPIECDLQKCSFKCFDKKLNLKYYNKKKNIYKNISKDKLDLTTFINIHAVNEINYAKDKLKELFKFKYVYTLKECVNIIKNLYISEKKELFEDFFIFKALDDLIPITENDFNNFKDTIYDKFNIPGYVIYRNIYYIFQPFELNENVSMYYRTIFHSNIFNDLSIYSYLKTTDILSLINKSTDTVNNIFYNFKNIINYYNKKKEYNYIGIIDKVSSNKLINTENIPDTFKLRLSFENKNDKKRGIGIQKNVGGICETSQNKQELNTIFKKIKSFAQKNFVINNKILDSSASKTNTCNNIKILLHFLEKYSTTKLNNKFTYFIIPDNHETYKFPINLEDKIQDIIQNIENNNNNNKFDYDLKKDNNGIFENIRDKNLPKYTISINKNTNINTTTLKELKFTIKNNIWQLIIE